MLCVSVPTSNVDRVRTLTASMECVELRLDLHDPEQPRMERDELVEIIQNSKAHLVIADLNKDGEIENSHILKLARLLPKGYDPTNLTLDFSYENTAAQTAARRKGIRIIRSYHFFETTPSFGNLVHLGLYTENCDVVKIATTPSTDREVSNLISVMLGWPKIYTVGMGELGKMVRLTALVHRPEFPVYVHDGTITAPGQFSYEDALRLKELLCD